MPTTPVNSATKSFEPVVSQAPERDPQPQASILHPEWTQEVRHEVELVVKIDHLGKTISKRTRRVLFGVSLVWI